MPMTNTAYLVRFRGP